MRASAAPSRIKKSVVEPTYLFFQYGVEHGVDLLLDTGDDQGHALAHAVLQLVLELRVSDNRLAPNRHIGGFSVLDPVQCLSLRIDHEREATRTRHEDAVLDRKRICRQSLHVPVTDRPDVNHEWDDLDTRSDRHTPQITVTDAFVFDQVSTILLIERPAVADEGARGRTVAHQAALRV